MDSGIFATVEHRKLMELKNCGAVCPAELEDKAQLAFIEVKDKIKEVRKESNGKKHFLIRLVQPTMPVEREVDLMFETRQELIDHLVMVDVPTELCPILQEEKEHLIFLDRAARYASEGQKILDMFKRHHDVIVDSDRSLIVEWLLQNSQKIRLSLAA